MKLCPRCQVSKPLSVFYQRPNGSRAGYCKLCQSEARRARYATIPAVRHRAIAQGKAHYAANRDLRRAQIDAYDQEHRDRLARVRRERRLQTKHGIGIDQFEATRKTQGNRCANCRGEVPELLVDPWALPAVSLLCRVCAGREYQERAK